MAKRTQFSLASLFYLLLIAATALTVAVFVYRSYLVPRWRERQARIGTASSQPPVQVEVRRSEIDAHRSYRGFDLTSVPRSTDFANLPDLFEERPPGSKSFHVRESVMIDASGLDGTVYFVPDKNQFYIQSDPVASSTLTFFGPFDGDPRDRLIQPSRE